MDPSEYGVHETHCCKKCGCRYCDDDCPVVEGIVGQYDCEDCESSWYHLVEQLRAMSAEDYDKLLTEVGRMR